MLNRDIYQTDPSVRKLANEGVANVNDDRTSEAMAVLRYELETFVCDGQYEKGLAHILDTFLRNIDQSEQAGVWISGFFGSGKSHLAKMLRALWVDTTFADGATARGLASLPESVTVPLVELSNAGRRHGGLHAASGTLGASASGSVRLALLNVIFKSADLPTQYSLARFVLWLRQEGIYDAVRERVESGGAAWQEELDNLYVAEDLHRALMAVKPGLFSSPAACVDTINNLFPFVQDVSNDDMVKSIRQVLTKEGKFPLTLVVLDEVQQFIGEEVQRAHDVQEVVETCSKSFAGKLLFVGTGQTAITGTPSLRRLAGRFTVGVELSDADVDSVIRKVILAKKPGARPSIEQTMTANLGEVSRHLAGTTLAHRQDDVADFAAGYPILPVRRRFWESTLRVLDESGTEAMLRNQLSMVHRAVQTNLERGLGNVLPADYLYFDSADRMLRTRVLPRTVHEKTMSWLDGSADEQLQARACGLVFLINKLSGRNKEIGIRATADTLADLLVTDLPAGSASLRSTLPKLLDSCELLIKVGDEYRIQTEESAAWQDEFSSQRTLLAGEAHRIDAERNDRVRRRVASRLKMRTLLQGDAKVSREIAITFDAQLPKDADQRIYVWVRDGWANDEGVVLADARQAGTKSPAIFVFVPKRSPDDLRRNLIDLKAATTTLEKRGVPTSPEGAEARAAMETTRAAAEARATELLDDALSGARVFQAGGEEIVGSDLQEMILEAANKALTRLYPNFRTADHVGWATVYAKAQKGASDALKAVGDDGNAEANPVCKAILASIGPGKSGAELRDRFEGAPYGWSRDAVDGGLQVLLVAGGVRAQDDFGRPIKAQELERKAIGKAFFKVESVIITAAQRIQIRKLFQKAGVQAAPNEEAQAVALVLQKLSDLADSAGGDAPKPAGPDKAILDEIRLTAGNEQLRILYDRREELEALIDEWTAQAKRIAARWPAWQSFARLLAHIDGLENADVIKAQAQSMVEQRLLLAEPDPCAPLTATLAQGLREALNGLAAAYDKAYADGLTRLEADANWGKLETEQRDMVLAKHRLTAADRPVVRTGITEYILETLDALTLEGFADRVAALKGRFDAALLDAARLIMPKVRPLKVPPATLTSAADVDAWVESVRATLQAAVADGPVAIH